MKKGFTLLELIVVIIILGILATLGFSQYAKMIEKSRISEAKMILGQIRAAQAAYKVEYNSYTATMANLPVEVNTYCDSEHYFSYSTDDNTAKAQRCGGGGKTPNYTGTSYNVIVGFQPGTFSGSTAGYY